MKVTFISCLLPLAIAGRASHYPGGGPGYPGNSDPGYPGGHPEPNPWYPPIEMPSHCGPYPRAYCKDTNFNASLQRTYLCGDFRLGPIKLPQRLPLDSVFDIYDRFGGLCPGDFLSEFWNPVEKWWRYPPFPGFSLDDNGVQISGNVTLAMGVLIDRFGGEGGNFTSPAAAPYMQRSLPPTNLDAPQDEWPYFPYNYHLYMVLQPLVVIAGPIAPWFRQPGQGVQYEMYSNISTLVATGYLKRMNPKALIPAP